MRAWRSYRRNKGATPAALGLEFDIERVLADLEDQLLDKTWQPGRSSCFVVDRPKLREVWAAEPIDRIVHYLFYNRIAPRVEPTFIADSFACIKGRGTLRAVERLERQIRSITQNWTRRGWYLKCDIATFFPSIRKRIAWGLLERHIPGPWWRWLTQAILFHDPRTNYELHSTPAKLALVPEHKSLFNRPADQGLAIGNLPSQFIANVTLNPLDQLIKRRLGVRYYVRYVDDFILLHQSPQQLNAWRDEICEFLSRALGIELNPSKTILQPIERGVDFVGQVIKPWNRTLRKRTARVALDRIAAADMEDLYAMANSYFGMHRQATHGHTDRARVARAVLRRGLAVDRSLTKAYPLGEAA